MKLWHKILLLSLALYAFAFNLSSIVFLSQTHLQNLAQETERAFSDQAIIGERIEAGLQATGASGLENPGPLMQRYAAYYQSRQIELALYRVSTGTMYGSLMIQELDPALLEIEPGVQKAAVRSRSAESGTGNTNRIHVSSPLLIEPDYLLLYARDITAIYNQRRQMIQTFLAIDLLMAVVIGLAAYFLARRLTRPLEKLGQATEQIAGGQYSMLVPESRDETARLVRSFNRMSEAIKTREETLQELARQRQQFIDNLTHEMNTPLTSIQGYAALLQQARMSQEQQQQSAGTIEREARRLRELYDKLMQLLLARRGQVDYKPIELVPYFENIRTIMAIQLDSAGIELEIQCQLDRIEADPALLEVLLTNLIRNAIQASEQGSRIILAADTTEDGSSHVLSVTDHGSGIAQDQVDQIFEPFYRVDRSRSRKTGGAGLGLSLCQEIASQHQGRLRVRSTAGEGTRMELHLPVDRSTSL